MRPRTLALLTLSASGVLAPGCDRARPLESPPTADLPAVVAAESGSRLAAPSNAHAAASSTSAIEVGWRDNAGDETHVEVLRSTSGEGGTFTLRARLRADVVVLGDPGLAPGTEYCYKMRASRVTGSRTTYSAFSNTACATTPPNVPGAPAAASGSRTFPLSSSRVRVSWVDNSSNEAGFRIDRSTDGGAGWSLAGTVPANYASFEDPDRQSEQPVCYRVISFNAGGDAAPSGTACTTPPAAPTNLVGTLVNAQSGTIVLSWTDNSAVESGYEVWGTYIYIPPCDGPACDAGYYEYDGIIAVLPANSTAYSCEGCGASFFYVRAVTDGGRSDDAWWGPPE